MSDPQAKQELRPYLRSEPPPADSVIIVRGGPSSLTKLAEHARRTYRVFMLDGEPIWGISVYCAPDDIGAASIDGLLRRFASYRVVHLPRVSQLTAAGFALLPSFGRPHFTVRLVIADEEELVRLLDALGSAQANPYYWKRPRRR